MTTNDIINPANLVYAKAPIMNDVPMHYCPGCSHGVVHKLIAEIIGELYNTIKSRHQRGLAMLKKAFISE